MANLGDAINLYISTLKRLKDEAERNELSLGAVSDGKLYVDGQQYEFDSVSPDRVIDGDVVYAARTDEAGRMVVFG